MTIAGGSTPAGIRWRLSTTRVVPAGSRAPVRSWLSRASNAGSIPKREPIDESVSSGPTTELNTAPVMTCGAAPRPAASIRCAIAVRMGHSRKLSTERRRLCCWPYVGRECNHSAPPAPAIGKGSQAYLAGGRGISRTGVGDSGSTGGEARPSAAGASSEQEGYAVSAYCHAAKLLAEASARNAVTTAWVITPGDRRPHSTMSSIEMSPLTSPCSSTTGRHRTWKAAIRSSATPTWSSERHVCTGREITCSSARRRGHRPLPAPGRDR